MRERTEALSQAGELHTPPLAPSLFPSFSDTKPQAQKQTSWPGARSWGRSTYERQSPRAVGTDFHNLQSKMEGKRLAR